MARKRPLKKEKVYEIAKLLKQGLKSPAVAKKLDVSLKTVQGIRCGGRWSSVTGITPGYFEKKVPDAINIANLDRFYGTLTDYARQVYNIMTTYRNSSRENPLCGYKMISYRADLNHSFNGENFTVFEAEKNGATWFVCYSDGDSLQLRRYVSLKKRLSF